MGLNIFSLLSTPLTPADLGWTGLAAFPPRSSEWVQTPEELDGRESTAGRPAPSAPCSLQELPVVT